MASLTRSSSDRPAAGNARAAWSIVAGLLAVATMPAAIVATRYSADYELAQAGFAIPVAVLLGVVAIVLARQAAARDRVTLGRAGGLKTARAGRLLGVLGICLGASATVSLIVYGLLLSID
jgi:hypothetical protein